MTYELGILGAGNMAEAIVRGVVGRGIFRPDQIIAADPVPARRELFNQQLNVRCVDDNGTVAAGAGILLVSTKPYQLREVLGALGGGIPESTLIISIAAGIGTQAIEGALGEGRRWRVVRAMPNTPMVVGEGMVGIAPGQYATHADMATARRIFESAADVVEVSEDRIDAVTAVSGSGPAYFYYVVEQMIRAGIEMGFSEEHARRLAVKTCVGAGRMLASATESPAELRRKVTTPGGTTHAAITVMEERGLASIVVDALKAAEQRGKEMGK